MQEGNPASGGIGWAIASPIRGGIWLTGLRFATLAAHCSANMVSACQYGFGGGCLRPQAINTCGFEPTADSVPLDKY